jgi:hypothetical protein
MSSPREPVSPNQPFQAPVLGYDHYSAPKDRRSRVLVPGYWLGALIAGSVCGVLATVMKLTLEAEPALAACIEGFVVSFGFGFVFLLPATIALGITLWLRAKFLKFAGFARFRAAVMLGFIGGAGVSIPYGFVFARVSNSAQVVIFFAILGWSIFFPIAAGFWLCRISHVRH